MRQAGDHRTPEDHVLEQAGLWGMSLQGDRRGTEYAWSILRTYSVQHWAGSLHYIVSLNFAVCPQGRPQPIHLKSPVPWVPLDRSEKSPCC